ncbi:hypothetical protein BJ138DRAFT_1141018 [Hygrophoropsis aurantiaca]|uniref:Uncharacterized protein n=1 Tax=Hygrophoropsis aurantiaca TaxID=72124 RepID=A0ACB8AS68_9AGAM|nr:hypothetical protein BJ138DRAFT_1141018 [Hygrophoropsis aurantiaca]
MKNWTRIYPWIPFFYHSFLADRSAAHARLVLPTSILDVSQITSGFLSVIYDKFPSARPQIANTPALRTTIMGLWTLATDLQPGIYQTPVGPLSFLRESISRVVAYCLTSNATAPIFPAFITAAGGISVVVDTTLEYLCLLRKEVTASKAESSLTHDSWSSYTMDFAHISEILLVASKREEVAREEFISKGSVHIMASLLTQLRAKLPEDPDDRTFPRVYEYILYAMLESDDGASVLCEAFAARILETILQASHMKFNYTDDYRRDHESDVVFLSELPHLLMHKKVLYMAAKSLWRVRSQDIERHAHRDGVLLKAWGNLKDAVARFSQVEKKLCSFEGPTYEFTCGAGQECVSRGQTSPDLYRCSGCLTVKYCSRHCQRTDWKKRHRHQCRIIRLAIGKAGLHDIRRNLLLIAAIETEDRILEGARLERLVADARRSNPDYLGELVVELDMTIYPFTHSVQALGRYGDVFTEDYRYEELLLVQKIRSASYNIFEIVKLRYGNKAHYLLSPSSVLRVIFDWPPVGTIHRLSQPLFNLNESPGAGSEK